MITENQLMEELIHLDEIAGMLDPESNDKIQARRVALKQQILELRQAESNAELGYN